MNNDGLHNNNRDVRLLDSGNLYTKNPYETINVLDGQGKITLLDTMPCSDCYDEDPVDHFALDRAIAQAARTSYKGQSKGDEADKKLVIRLLRDHHTSPFEMVQFKFRVEAPVVVWWQWVRHRMASYNFQSGRYTEFKDDQVYIPTPSEWRLQHGTNKQMSEGNLDVERGFILSADMDAHMIESLRLYHKALDMGVAREQARFFLPGFNMMYTAIVKVDAKNLMDFLRLRMAPDAQYEIRVYAQAIYDYIFKPLMPWTAEAFETYVLKKE